MQNKILFIFCFLVQITFCFAQQIQIDYFVTLNRNISSTSTQQKYTLFFKNNKSLYQNYHSDNVNQFRYKDSIQQITEKGNITQVKVRKNVSTFTTQDYFYKDYTQDSLFFNDFMLSRKKFVRENISNLFKWNIIPNTDSTILGYKCQKATADFRGRKYVAYFTNKIAMMGGPWKFDGLPGMILYVYSDEKYFIIQPQKIIINAKIEDIKNPYTKEKVMPFEEFRNKLEEGLNLIDKRLKTNSSVPSQSGVSIEDSIEDLGLKGIPFKK